MSKRSPGRAAVSATHPPTVPLAPDRGALSLDGQADRLWAHALHADAEVVQRGNFYLVGESMLVVAYTAILTAGPNKATGDVTLAWVARIVAMFGIVLALIWWYAGHVHWVYLKHIRMRAITTLPEYRETWENRPAFKFNAGTVHTYAVPGVTLLMWIGLILLV